jgi:hypothetical protein
LEQRDTGKNRAGHKEPLKRLHLFLSCLELLQRLAKLWQPDRYALQGLEERSNSDIVPSYLSIFDLMRVQMACLLLAQSGH